MPTRVFNKVRNKFQDPVKLRRLIVDLIDKEDWSTMSAEGRENVPGVFS